MTTQQMINYLMTTTNDKLFDDDKQMINYLMTTTTNDKLFDDDDNK